MSNGEPLGKDNNGVEEEKKTLSSEDFNHDCSIITSRHFMGIQTQAYCILYVLFVTLVAAQVFFWG